MNFKIIGLTGVMASGKGEVVKLLVNRGFKYISLSDIVRREVALRGVEVNRSEMQDIGNSLRAKGGAGVLGSMVREEILSSSVSHWVVDGIRNPAEVEELKKIKGFQLWAVEVKNIGILIDRIKLRRRQGDSEDENVLKERIMRELGKNEPPDGQQVEKSMAMADWSLDNSSSLEELHKVVEKKLKEIV